VKNDEIWQKEMKFGGCFGGCSFPTFVHFQAAHYKEGNASITLILNK